MGNPQLLVLFLKALIAAKKSLSLYPVGSEMATGWIDRLHRSLDGFIEQGMSFPVRVGRDRFSWVGEELLTIDPTLEAFRFDLESRGISEFSIDPAVENWELQAFLDLLNQPPASIQSIAGGSAFLHARNVVHVSVGGPGIGATPAEDSADSPSLRAMQTGKDDLDLFVDTVLKMVEERLGDLMFDRTGLASWFQALCEGNRVDRLCAAVRVLGTMAEGGTDREIRVRTMLEALLHLPGATLRPFLTQWLLPAAGSDLVAFNLLTQVTEDELADIARLVPQDQLLSLSSELLEFPWEEGKRQRLLEAIAWTIRRQSEPEAAIGPAAPLLRDDPLLVELRQEIMAACQADVLLDRSTDILLALIFSIESDEYPGFAVDAIEEIVGEALARGKLDLAVRVLSTLSTSTQIGGEGMREHARRLAIFRRRVAGRTQVSLVAGLLRQNVETGQMALAAEYLRLVTGEGVEEFTTMLADERDRRVRARMCQVLARVGPSIIPTLLPWFEDPRWYVVRNIVHILGRLGHDAAFSSLISALDHAHPRVRIEAIRALTMVGGGLASGPIQRCVNDPDPAVRRAMVKALGSVRNDDAVPTLRDLVASPTRTPEDLEIKQHAIDALATIGSPSARAALARLASRRVWFWERTERRVRGMAVEALSAKRPLVAATVGADDGG